MDVPKAGNRRGGNDEELAEMIHLIPPALALIAVASIVWRVWCDWQGHRRFVRDTEDLRLRIEAWLALSEEERAERTQEPFGRVEQ